jgi:hypothetical protein
MQGTMQDTEEQIIASAGGTSSIPTHPEGQFAATCIDVVDLGMVETTWQGQTRKKHKVFVRFFCGEWFDGNEGKAPLWVDRRFTCSLNDGSDLKPFLEAWRGRKFTEEELRGFNIAKLVGVPAFLQIAHNVKADRTYANVDGVMKLPPKYEAPEAPADYVRVKDRPKSDADAAHADDSDIPF